MKLTESAARGVESRAKDTPEKIRDAAQQFEAVLLTQLMKEVQDSASTGLGGEENEDQAGQQAISMAQEFLAQSMAASGGLGIAKLVMQGLKKS